MAGTEESILVLGGPNITVKVCVSLKILLIVTFNIKAIRTQSSKCSHPVKLPFGQILTSLLQLFHLFLKQSVVCYLHIVYRLTYSSTGKSNIYRCNQNYGLQVFFSGEASKFLSKTYALTNLTPRTTTPSAPCLSFNRIQLRSHYIIFYFSRTSVRYNRRK